MTTTCQQAIVEVESLTRQMLDRAIDAEWEQVCELEAVRQGWLARIFPLEVDHEEGQVLQLQIRRLIEWDQQIIRLVHAKRKDLGDQLSRIKQGRKANHAYQVRGGLD